MCHYCKIDDGGKKYPIQGVGVTKIDPCSGYNSQTWVRGYRMGEVGGLTYICTLCSMTWQLHI